MHLPECHFRALWEEKWPSPGPPFFRYVAQTKPAGVLWEINMAVASWSAVKGVLGGDDQLDPCYMLRLGLWHLVGHCKIVELGGPLA